jgi:hypothetical protein
MQSGSGSEYVKPYIGNFIFAFYNILVLLSEN